MTRRELGDRVPACIVCMDTGNSPVKNGQFIFDAPCPECSRGDRLSETLREARSSR